MNKNSKILFFGRKKCSYSKKIITEIFKYSKNIKYILSGSPKDKLPKKSLLWSGDYIISFRSYFILPSSLIKKASIAAINLHPGPPQYRGIGCVNFAILNSEKNYGITCHLMSPNIDKGKIIDVKKFKIQQKDNIDSVLKKTYSLQVHQSKMLLKKINSNNKALNIMIEKSKKIKWSKKLYTRRQLDDLYTMNNGSTINLTNINTYLRATITKKFKPFIIADNKKFFLTNEK